MRPNTARCGLRSALGVSALQTDIKDEEELHHRADTALLAAKRRGRNNVCIWEEKVKTSGMEVAGLLNDDLSEICHTIRKLTLPARERYMDSVRPVLDALYRRHPRLRRHSTNVTIFAMELARLLDMTPDEQEALEYAALFHDIGHVTTPAEILDKPGSPYGGGEARRAQPCAGQRKAHARAVAFGTGDRLRAPTTIERYDGSGHPDRAAGDAIPLGARHSGHRGRL